MISFNWHSYIVLCACFGYSLSFSAAEHENIVKGQNLFCFGETMCDRLHPINNFVPLDEFGYPYPDKFLDSLPVKFTDQVSPDCCGQCSCDPVECVRHGTCCPDILDRVPSVEESESRHTLTCRYGTLNPDENRDAYWMYDRCADHYNDKGTDVRARCEHPDKFMDLDTRTPVTDTFSRFTFFNKFCALCNNVNATMMVAWKMTLKCLNSADSEFIGGLTAENIVERLAGHGNCNLIYNIPPIKNFKKPSCAAANLVDRCNTTKQWVTYDPLIEAACHAYISPYRKYKNIYCFMCNEIVLPAADDCIPTGGRFDIFSFSALLNFNSADTTDNDGSQCKTTEMYDSYKRTCRTLTCRFPRQMSVGQCRPVVETIAGVAYVIYVKLDLDEPHVLFPGVNVVVFLTNEVLNLLRVSGDTGLHDTDLYYQPLKLTAAVEDPVSNNKTSTAMASEEPGSESVVFVPPIPELKAHSADYFVARISLYFYNYYIYPKLNISLLDEILSVDETRISMQNSLLGINFNATLTLEDLSTSEYPELIGDLSANTSLVRLQPVKDLFMEPVEKLPIEVVTEKLRCPLVTINENDYNVQILDTGIHIQELNATFDLQHVYLVNGTRALICADMFLRAAAAQAVKIVPDQSDAGAASVQAIVSIVFTILSIVCCLATLITYLLFSELRTQPGINNMCLLVSLIIAQVLFQFGIGASEAPAWGCQLIGALVHYFWLTVLLWMNVCSFHMFVVFRRKNVVRTKNYRKTTLMYSLYVLMLPLLFLAINLAVRYTATDGDDVGYGGNKCYISTPDMIRYVFALPIGIIIATNLCFFIAVIVLVRRTKMKDSDTKHSRNFLKIYTKLSTITGLSWLFGFLFVFTNVAVLEYLFIILNAGIGVFLFLSFVCNRRVLNLYRGRFCLSSEKYGESTPGTTTTDTGSNTENTRAG